MKEKLIKYRVGMIICCQDIQLHEHTKLPSRVDSQNTWCLVFSFHTSFIPCFPRSSIRIRTVSSSIHRIFAGLKQNRSRAFLFQEFQTNFYRMRKNLDARSTSVSVKPFSAVIHIPECFIYLFLSKPFYGFIFQNSREGCVLC